MGHSGGDSGDDVNHKTPHKMKTCSPNLADNVLLYH